MKNKTMGSVLKTGHSLTKACQKNSYSSPIFAGRPEISITGRISIVPTRAAGICPAIAIASSINQQHVFHCLFGSPFSSSRARSTAGPGSKSSSSKNWRISISPSPLLWGAGARFAHSMASCLDFTWMIQYPAISTGLHYHLIIPSAACGRNQG